MIIRDDSIREVRWLSSEQKQRICAFLQGAVYCWRKNRPNDWFALRDLMGGENYVWDETPMIALYEKYKNEGYDEPEKRAGIDGGYLLKKVIDDMETSFDTRNEDGYHREYLWLPPNDEHN